MLARISGVRALSFERYIAIMQAAITAWRWPSRNLRDSSTERVISARRAASALREVFSGMSVKRASHECGLSGAMPSTPITTRAARPRLPSRPSSTDFQTS